MCIDFVVCLGFLVASNYFTGVGKFIRIFQIATLGYLLLYLCDFLNIGQAIMTIASSIHGSLSLMDLCDAWIDRFVRYKRYSKLEFQQLLVEVNCKREIPLTLVTVKKDLFERYLLIVGILSKTSDIWSFSLACYILACLFAFFFFAYFAYTTSQALFYFWKCLILVFIFLLISSIAYTNSAISSLNKGIC